jgi:hypothetical protein
MRRTRTDTEINNYYSESFRLRLDMQVWPIARSPIHNCYVRNIFLIVSAVRSEVLSLTVFNITVSSMTLSHHKHGLHLDKLVTVVPMLGLNSYCNYGFWQVVLLLITREKKKNFFFQKFETKTC